MAFGFDRLTFFSCEGDAGGPFRGWHAPLVQKLLHDMVTVDDDQLLDAMLFLWERMKIVVEPTGALAAAALFERKIDYKSGARIGVIVSGGNVDVRAACALIRARDARKQGGAA
jgi:threonine dehydratase